MVVVMKPLRLTQLRGLEMARVQVRMGAGLRRRRRMMAGVVGGGKPCLRVYQPHRRVGGELGGVDGADVVR